MKPGLEGWQAVWEGLGCGVRGVGLLGVQAAGLGPFGAAVLLRHQGDGVLAKAILHVVEEVRLLIAGEGALEALVLERLPGRPRDVVRLFGLPLLQEAHAGA